MKSFSLRLPDSLEASLTAAARARGMAKSDVLRAALESYLKGDESARPGSCLDAASDLAGCVEGPGDLSVNRKHMTGYGE